MSLNINAKLSNEAKELGISMPVHQTNGSAGVDLCAIEGMYILPGEARVIKTGLSIELPIGYEAQIRPRSGLALKHTVTVLNTPGTIDSDYRGYIGVILINHSKEMFTVYPGDRIAQMVVSKCEQITLVEEDTLSETERGSGGFGSTGRVGTKITPIDQLDKRTGSCSAGGVGDAMLGWA